MLKIASHITVPLAATSLLLCLCLAVPVTAQSTPSVPDLVTDRPDQTESAAVVPRGHGQIEIGWTFTRDREAGVEVESHEAPGTLLRLGIHERVELRIGWAGWVRESVDFAGSGRHTTEGLGDMDLGAKFVLVEGTERRPQLAWLVATSVPVGEAEVSSDSYDPSFRFLLDHELNDSVGFGVNLGAEWQEVSGPFGGEEQAASLVFTAALGWAVGETWGTFYEVFGSESISGPDLPSELSFDAGITWLVRPSLQLDLSAGVGLNDASPDSFVGLGVSYRWPSRRDTDAESAASTQSTRNDSIGSTLDARRAGT